MLRHDEEGVATRTRFRLESTSFPVCRTAILPMRGVAPGRKRKTPAWFRQANSLHRKDLSTPRRASVELAGRHHNGSITVTHYRRPSESCQKTLCIAPSSHAGRVSQPGPVASAGLPVRNPQPGPGPGARPAQDPAVTAALVTTTLYRTGAEAAYKAALQKAALRCWQGAAVRGMLHKERHM